MYNLWFLRLDVTIKNNTHANTRASPWSYLFDTARSAPPQLCIKTKRIRYVDAFPEISSLFTGLSRIEVGHFSGSLIKIVSGFRENYSRLKFRPLQVNDVIF